MGTVENYTEAMTRTLTKRAFRRQVDRIGFDAAARQYEKWMEESEFPRRRYQSTFEVRDKQPYEWNNSTRKRQS